MRYDGTFYVTPGNGGGHFGVEVEVDDREAAHVLHLELRLLM